MARLGCADEVVVADIQKASHVAERAGDLIGKLLRREPARLSRALDLLPVLVGAGQKPDVATVQPHESRQHIAGHSRVSVTEMGQVVDVIDRRGQKIWLVGSHNALQSRHMGARFVLIQQRRGAARRNTSSVVRAADLARSPLDGDEGAEDYLFAVKIESAAASKASRDLLAQLCPASG